MGKVTAVQVRELLLGDNPGAPLVDVSLFADALVNYFEATANLAENGAIVADPRTGAPFENPYLKIQERAGAILRKFTHLETDNTLARCRQLHGQA